MKMTRETFERAQELHEEIKNLTELKWAIINCLPNKYQLATIKPDGTVVNTAKLSEATRLELKHQLDRMILEKEKEFDLL